MREPTTELTDQARSIFDQLGYTVIDDGQEIRAERDWKVVQVTPTRDSSTIPERGSLRCFVTPQAVAPELRRELRNRDLEYEWAIIAVADDDYDVMRAPPGPAS